MTETTYHVSVLLSVCVLLCPVPTDTSGPMGGGLSSSRGGQAATRGSWQAGMTLNNPPGAVTRDKLSWIKGARVFIVFLPHREKWSRLFAGSSSPRSSWLNHQSCQAGDI